MVIGINVAAKTLNFISRHLDSVKLLIVNYH